MHSSSEIFQNRQQFHDAFTRKLSLLTESNKSGVFILVLANALMSQQLFSALIKPVKAQSGSISEYLDSLSSEALDQLPGDDLEIFRHCENLHIETLSLASKRQCGRFSLAYHPLRGLRPTRNSNREIHSLHQPFEENRFHFNKPFLQEEILWQGSLHGQNIRLMYNKFPFAAYHCILLINPENKLPQFLHEQQVLLIEKLLQQFNGLGHVVLAYNSLAAFASVNHQHWQMFLEDEEYPIESDIWTHNGGSEDYPLKVIGFERIEEYWEAINHCQSSQQPFNLFARQGRYWLIIRKNQSQITLPDWCSGLAWSEVTGNLQVQDQQTFEQLEENDIIETLNLLKV